MRDEFPMAKARVKTKNLAFSGEPGPSTDIGHEVFKVGLGVILCTAAIIGMNGFLFFMGGLIKSSGIIGFVKGWISACTGI